MESQWVTIGVLKLTLMEVYVASFGKQPLKNFVDEQSDLGPGSQGVC